MEVVGIHLGNKKRVYYFSPNNIELKINDTVVVETEKGYQYGIVTIAKEDISREKLYGDLKKVIRIATNDDKIKYEENLKDAKEALKKSKELATKHKLNMLLISAEFTLNKEQLMFRFLADDRVDFRSLARDLAGIYHTRIELYQIGVRDKAKEVGGLGPCGQQLCCSRFLNEFDTVSINMAKNQNIALNPTKINGLCGRLLCCLKYEDECYRECKKELPNIGSKYTTEKGEGKVISLDILQHKFRVYVQDHGVVEVTK